MSLGKNTGGGAKSTLEDRICAFLKGRGNGVRCTALEIAKGVGMKTAKDVNSTLYNLQKKGHLYKTEDTPPLWSLARPNESPTAPRDRAHSPNSSLSEDDIKDILAQSRDQGLTAQDIAKKLDLNPRTVKKKLYDMSRGSMVEQLNEHPPRWSCYSGKKNKNEEESSDSQDYSESLSSGVCSESESTSTCQATVSWFSKNYDFEEHLGEGGFGRVFKVKAKLDKKYYAVKVVKSNMCALREVEALASFQHPNIVRYYCTWEELGYPQHKESHASTESTTQSEEEEDESQSSEIINGTSVKCLYIQMEFCAGGTLTQWIRKKNEERNRTREDSLMIFQQIVQGVEYIHSQRRIHRDLKPDNILFGSEDIVKIGDFGLVTASEEDGSSVKRTKDRGTPMYMSPEQEEKSSYDEKVDIFPLGLICFELLWEIKTVMERVKLLVDLRKRIFPPEFCEKYSSEHKIIGKMLSEVPDKRPRASAIAEGLKALLEDHDGMRYSKTV